MTKKSAATNVIAVRAHFFADTQSVGAPPPQSRRGRLLAFSPPAAGRVLGGWIVESMRPMKGSEMIVRLEPTIHYVVKVPIITSVDTLRACSSVAKGR